ncbi:MAG: hypothetical protein Q4F02_01040 [Candidatus Saccharibacteria bacterium]|nr:hypothetical protein [Candidatus Saccharibacteria bacterium]
MDKETSNPTNTPETPDNEPRSEKMVRSVGKTAIQASLLSEGEIKRLEENERNRISIEQLMQPELGPDPKSVREAQGWMAQENDLVGLRPPRELGNRQP